MRLQILLHPQLRASLPRCTQRDLNSRLFTRLKTTQKAPRPSRDVQPTPRPKAATPHIPKTSQASQPKTLLRRGPPERILIYHGGTGSTIFLGMLRVSTIFLFGISCVVVAPAFFAADYPSYVAPAIMVAGALPMVFVAYTSAPFVNFIHLTLPVAARRSKEHAYQYAKKLPPTATLHINTMKFTTIPRQTEVRFGDLVPDKKLTRPVSFRNQNPSPPPWWQWRSQQHFFTREYSKPGWKSSTFYPELWSHVYRQIQNKGL